MNLYKDTKTFYLYDILRSVADDLGNVSTTYNRLVKMLNDFADIKVTSRQVRTSIQNIKKAGLIVVSDVIPQNIKERHLVIHVNSYDECKAVTEEVTEKVTENNFAISKLANKEVTEEVTESDRQYTNILITNNTKTKEELNKGENSKISATYNFLLSVIDFWNHYVDDETYFVKAYTITDTLHDRLETLHEHGIDDTHILRGLIAILSNDFFRYGYDSLRPDVYFTLDMAMSLQMITKALNGEYTKSDSDHKAYMIRLKRHFVNPQTGRIEQTKEYKQFLSELPF